MILLPPTRPLYAALDPVDFRRSFDVLVAFAREQLGLDALRSAVVLFVNRDGSRCKLLFHDGSGLVILYKRQGSGHEPRNARDRSVAIEPRELALLLEGHIRHRP